MVGNWQKVCFVSCQYVAGSCFMSRVHRSSMVLTILLDYNGMLALMTIIGTLITKISCAVRLMSTPKDNRSDQRPPEHTSIINAGPQAQPTVTPQQITSSKLVTYYPEVPQNTYVKKVLVDEEYPLYESPEGVELYQPCSKVYSRYDKPPA